MAFLAAWFWRNAIRKGVLGGSRPWLLVAVVTGAIRLLKRLNSGSEHERLGITLLPGERIELSVTEPERRRRRKAR